MADLDDTQLSNPFLLPGYNLPLHFAPNGGKDLFNNALNVRDDGHCVQLQLTTLREFTMLQLMNKITDKPDWHEKIFDETIALKWRSEALSAPDVDITEKMVDYCIAELQHKAKTFDDPWAVVVYNGDVVKSDHAVPTALKDALKSAVSSLENVPNHEKDWHPGSDDKVLDLVHPSLYPLVYGKSRILPDTTVGLQDCLTRCGEGETLPVPSSDDLPSDFTHHDPSTNPYSTKFQWLPCEVDISEGEGHARITSYINNLHPEKHKDLYRILSELIAKTIPLWNLTLTPVHHLAYANYNPSRIEYTGCEYDPNPEYGPATDGPQEADFADNEDFWQARNEWFKATRKVVLPEPKPFQPPEEEEDDDDETFYKVNLWKVNLWKDVERGSLQVIVKLANIHLTPEKPVYEGGTWHVEGKVNEHICASAIYYYDSENITTSRLAFRQLCESLDIEIDYEQDHHDWLPAVFGCEPDGNNTQDVGTVDTPEGRLLTWPNLLQHQVQPFRLADPTKPGHRKIVALFLVDPHIRVISTANVPPQQREWWSEYIQQKQLINNLTSLPLEVQDHIFDGVDDFPISLEEAKALRAELMEERKRFVVSHGEQWQSHSEFSLCEH